MCIRDRCYTPIVMEDVNDHTSDPWDGWKTPLNYIHAMREQQKQILEGEFMWGDDEIGIMVPLLPMPHFCGRKLLARFHPDNGERAITWKLRMKTEMGARIDGEEPEGDGERENEADEDDFEHLCDGLDTAMASGQSSESEQSTKRRGPRR